MKGLLELFQDSGGQMSMSRLLCFMSFFPASYVVTLTKNPDALGWYLGAYAVGYIGGKFGDAMIRGNNVGNSKDTSE